MSGRRRSFLALIALVALANGCSSGGATTPVVGSIVLSLSPTSATIQQGASTQVTGTVTRTNFTGDIAISVNGAPTGVSGSVTLAPVNGGNSAQVTLSASNSTVVGTYSLTVVAKGSGIDSTTATFTLTIAAATPASYTMAVGTPSQSIAQSGTALSALTFVRTAFTGNITLSAENLPTGVTAAFATNPVSGTTSSVTFAASPTATPGSFNTILIRGTASGLTDVTAGVTLVVTVTGSFTIAAGNASLSVVQGNNASTSVNATRVGGFGGTIVYSVTGPSNAALPAGLTAAVTPTATADQNTLTVTTTAGLAPATYPIVVHAVSFGPEQTANVSVVVTALGSAVRLDYSLCAAGGKPVWVAFQDGAGAWTHVAGSADVYSFNVASANGAIAVVTTGANYVTAINYMSQGELAAFTGGCAPTGKTINGTVAGVTSGFLASISMGGGAATVAAPATTFQLVGLANGAQDLVAYNRNSLTPGAVNDGLILRRDLNVADGGSVPLIDFGSLEAVSPTTFTITLTGAPGGATITQVQSYLTGVTCSSHLLYTKSGTSATVFAYGVPTGLQRVTDYYNLSLTSLDALASSRQVSRSFQTLANMTIALGASISATVTDVTGGATYRRVQSVLALPSDYQSASLIYTGVVANSVTISQSTGYIGGAASVTLAMPDLTAAGYLAAYGPGTANAVNYLTSARGTSGGGAGCNQGGTTKVATVTGIF